MYPPQPDENSVIGTTLEDGLVCWFNLQDSFDDSLGRFNPDNIEGTPTYTEALGRTVMLLDGNTYARLPTTNFSGLITGAMSFSSHFYPSSERTRTVQGLILYYHGDWWVSGLTIHNDSGSAAIRYLVSTGSGQNESIILSEEDGSPEVTFDKWQNLTMTFDGSTMTMYIDGEYVTQKSASATRFNSNYYYLGRFNYSNRNFIGMMSSTAVWNLALTQDEVRMLYNDGTGMVY